MKPNEITFLDKKKYMYYIVSDCNFLFIIAFADLLYEFRVEEIAENRQLTKAMLFHEDLNCEWKYN